MNKQKRYILVGGKKKVYYIHDNGGRPFKVTIEGNHLHIHKQMNCDEETNKIIYTESPTLSFKTKEIFIGKSPKNELTKDSGYGKKFDGNTILAKLKHHEYVYIGSEVFSFNTDHPIKSYVSLIGNNDVPYPYATDSEGNIYLLIEDVILLNTETTKEGLKQEDNPYYYYYAYHQMTPDLSTTRPKKLKIDSGIKSFYLGNKPYTMTYYPFPEKEYDRLTKDIGKMYIVDNKNKKVKLNKAKYVELMQDFGETASFKPFYRKKHYLDRDINGSFIGLYMSAIKN